MLTGTVFVIAITAAIIDNEQPGFGPGIYVIYLGTLSIFIGSIINLRRSKRLSKREDVFAEDMLE